MLDAQPSFIYSSIGVCAFPFPCLPQMETIIPQPKTDYPNSLRPGAVHRSRPPHDGEESAAPTAWSPSTSSTSTAWRSLERHSLLWQRPTEHDIRPLSTSSTIMPQVQLNAPSPIECLKPIEEEATSCDSLPCLGIRRAQPPSPSAIRRLRPHRNLRDVPSLPLCEHPALFARPPRVCQGVYPRHERRRRPSNPRNDLLPYHPRTENRISSAP